MLISSFYGIPDLLQPFDLSEKIELDDDLFELHISMTQPDERCHRSEYWQAYCKITADIEPSKNVLLTFQALWSEQIPPGLSESDLPADTRSVFIETNKVSNYEWPLDRLHGSVKEFINNTTQKMHSVVLNYLGVFCWRASQSLPTFLYRARRNTWSMDGIKWKDTPVNFVMINQLPVTISENMQGHLRSLQKNNATEPLHYELFREAWTLKDRHPRSALILSTSALEAAVKFLLSSHFPQVRWLIEDLPSPPLYSILSKLFQTLPRVENSVLVMPSEQQIDEVKKWTNIRNSIVHGKKTSIKSEKLTSYLLLVKEILYMCDYANGHRWALSYIDLALHQ